MTGAEVGGGRHGLVIAIDGPAGAGKSSVAQRVADRLGLARLDTGAMYRALTWKALEEGIDPGDALALATLARRLDLTITARGVLIDGAPHERQIRSRRVSALVSRVSAHPPVRRVMVAKQRAFARRRSLVIEGRDIGTIVAPRADLKIFLTASATERARRRHRELAAAGVSVPLGTLATEIEARDARDARTTPLVAAADAVILDSTGKTLEQVVAEITRLAGRVRRASGKASGTRAGGRSITPPGGRRRRTVPPRGGRRTAPARRRGRAS